MNSGDVISFAQFDEICSFPDSKLTFEKGPFRFCFFAPGKGIYSVSYCGQCYGGTFYFSSDSYEDFLESCDDCICNCPVFTPRQTVLF